MVPSSGENNKTHVSLDWVILYRRKLRSRINANKHVDRILHLYTSSIFLVNIILIMYTLISLTSRMLISGVPLIDSLPLAFYILPLLVFLPKLLYDFYQSRSAILTIIILLVVAIIFGMITSLIRGFIILVFLNLLSIIIVIILGRFRPNTPLKSIGRRGLAWFLILNSIGLLLPVSIVVMGQVPIATATYSNDSTIYLEMPLDSYEYPFVNVSPTPAILSELSDASFGIDLRLNSGDLDALMQLQNWLIMLSSSNIPYRITSSYETSEDVEIILPGSPLSNRLSSLYTNHWFTINAVITIFEDLSLSTDNLGVSLDMTLSQLMWQQLMNQTRSINLQGFSELIRNSLEAINTTDFTNRASSISDLFETNNIRGNILVDGFVIDDYIDSDATLMAFCGINPDIIENNNFNFEIQCDRSQYSEGMAGDVGEYLVHTYSQSSMSTSIRLGIIGTHVGSEEIPTPVYETMETIASDIAIASNRGIEEIIVRSLPSIVSSFGIDGVGQLRDAIQSLEVVEITYTFRIFAFRAVVMAIDSFDYIMY